MSDSLWVTNEGSIPWTETFRGKEFSFLPGVPALIPRDMADLVFGHYAKDKTEFLARLGWIKYNSDVPAALERLAKFQVSEELPVKPRLVASAGGAVPLRVERPAGRKALVQSM